MLRNLHASSSDEFCWVSLLSFSPCNHGVLSRRKVPCVVLIFIIWVKLSTAVSILRNCKGSQPGGLNGERINELSCVSDEVNWGWNGVRRSEKFFLCFQLYHYFLLGPVTSEKLRVVTSQSVRESIPGVWRTTFSSLNPTHIAFRRDRSACSSDFLNDTASLWRQITYGRRRMMVLNMQSGGLKKEWKLVLKFRVGIISKS